MNSECQDTQYYNIPRLKLAVAFAILRLKPPELSARKYTEMIQARYLSSCSRLQDQNHQKKMQMPQLQMPQSQQQQFDKTVFLQDKNTDHAVVSESHPSGTVHPSDTDFCLKSPQPGTTNIISRHPEAKGEKCNNTADGILNQVLKPKNTANCNDTSLAPPVVDDFREVHILENSRFMHSVIELQGLTYQKPGQETDRLLKSACTHISTLRNVINYEVMILSESCMCNGAESVMMLTDSVTWIADRPEFMQEVCSLVECIITKFVQPASSGQFQNCYQKRVLMKMLLIFMKGKTVPLLCCILDSLVESVKMFCQKLKASQLHGVAVDPDLFENGYYIISCLELAMKTWAEDNPVHASILLEAQEKLDQDLLQIAHYFPLVAQALSRVTSLIEAILQNR